MMENKGTAIAELTIREVLEPGLKDMPMAGKVLLTELIGVIDQTAGDLLKRPTTEGTRALFGAIRLLGAMFEDYIKRNNELTVAMGSGFIINPVTLEVSDVRGTGGLIPETGSGPVQ